MRGLFLFSCLSIAVAGCGGALATSADAGDTDVVATDSAHNADSARSTDATRSTDSTGTPDSAHTRDGAAVDAKACAPPLRACDDACVDLGSDPMHCGSCGAVCASPLVCAMGTCTLSCGNEFTLCGLTCSSLISDSSNCGACGHACGNDEVCTGGVCVLSCGPLDAAGCGTTCAGVTCPVGQIACGPDCLCVDPMTDLQNCGHCGVFCGGPVNIGCINGQCGPIPCLGDPGEVACNGTCINPITDPTYCGATSGCGVADAGSAGQKCEVGEVCSGGVCSDP
jgi:hypothetical protein